MVDAVTPNFGLILPESNRKNWTEKANGNLRLIDSILASFVSVANLQGLWANNTEYDVGDNVTDEDSGVIYTAQVDHISSAAPTTFSEERTDNPTYWAAFAVAARTRGAWATNTAYALNDFVLAEGTKYAMCIVAHTSGANFATDYALSRWSVIIDLSVVGSLVLPVLSGAADANKVVITDTTGSSYIISSVTALLSLIGTTGSGSFVLSANPTLTGSPAAPTQTAEDNDTSIATTQYADRAVRNIVVRTQSYLVAGVSTYTPNAKLIIAKVEAVGSGGGGGGSVAAATGGQAGQGGGGGSGVYTWRWLTAAQIGASQTVTVPAGGAAGAAGNNAGNVGAQTSFGALLLAGGGGGGGGNSGVANNVALGGGGGVAGGTYDGSIPSKGGSTGVCAAQSNVGGVGGSSVLGTGGIPGITSATTSASGTDGSYGSGGGGGYAPNGGANAAGGAGGDGAVYITEYCYG